MAAAVGSLALYMQPRDSPCVLGSLPLIVGEVRRDSNNCTIYFLSEVSFSSGLHLLKDHGGDLLGGVRGVVDLDIGLLVLGDDLVGNELLVGLDGLVVVLRAKRRVSL